jgi:hypothetical protein
MRAGEYALKAYRKALIPAKVHGAISQRCDRRTAMATSLLQASHTGKEIGSLWRKTGEV